MKPCLGCEEKRCDVLEDAWIEWIEWSDGSAETEDFLDDMTRIEMEHCQMRKFADDYEKAKLLRGKS